MSHVLASSSSMSHSTRINTKMKGTGPSLLTGNDHSTHSAPCALCLWSITPGHRVLCSSKLYSPGFPGLFLDPRPRPKGTSISVQQTRYRAPMSYRIRIEETPLIDKLTVLLNIDGYADSVGTSCEAFETEGETAPVGHTLG